MSTAIDTTDEELLESLTRLIERDGWDGWADSFFALEVPVGWAKASSPALHEVLGVPALEAEEPRFKTFWGCLLWECNGPLVGPLHDTRGGAASRGLLRKFHMHGKRTLQLYVGLIKLMTP